MAISQKAHNISALTERAAEIYLEKDLASASYNPTSPQEASGTPNCAASVVSAQSIVP